MIHSALATVIGRMEGEDVVDILPNRPQRDNNPGDIEWGHFTQLHGATHGDPRFAVFPTADEGWAALEALLCTPVYQKLTITQLVAKYAPAVENDDNIYVQNACKWLGAKPTDKVSQYTRC